MTTKSLSLYAALLATTALLAPGLAHAQAQAAEQPAPTTAEDGVQEVVVKGKFIPNTMRRTAEVVSILSNEDLKRTGDDSAAAALTRVTGLSLVEGRFVYVRGLGERYSSALLNGSPLPSPEPLQRVVPLDLFPSSMLDRVSVQKTYSAEYPGEFGGGLIDLKTISVPKAPFLSMGIGTGGNSEAAFKKGPTHYGSDTDPIGFDDGTRSLPGALRQGLKTGKRITSANFNNADLQKIGQSLTNAPLNLIQEADKLPANFSFNIAAGTNVDVAGGELGIVGLVDFSNGWKAREAIQQTAEPSATGTLVLYDNFKARTTENDVSLNGVFGLGYRYENHNVQWTNILIRNTTKRTQIREGADGQNGEFRRRDSSGWYQRQMAVSQFAGDHKLMSDLKLNWRASYAKTSRDVPYEKQINYAKDKDGRLFHDASRVQNRTEFSLLEDVMLSAGASLTYDFSLGNGRDGSVTGGFDILDNQRDSESRAFVFRPANAALPEAVQYTRVDFLLSDFNINPDRLMISETTGSNGAAAYKAGQFVNAAFIKTDVAVLPLVRLAAGLRFESGKQRIATVSLFKEDIATRIPAIKEDYILPTATVTWNFADDMQLRVGASKTIGRPQFREMAPQVYLDPDQDRLFSGNPFLRDTEIMNFDARYEWYYDTGRHFTAGFFYKTLDKPVEATVLQQGNTNLQSYINAPKANLYGLEFDYKGQFDSPIEGAFFDSKKWILQANYTWTQSELKVGAGDKVTSLGANNTAQVDPATNFLKNGAKLQGQSEHVANLQFGWEDADAKSQATLLLTYVSERISARGAAGFPDFIQEPGTKVDFVYRKGFKALDRDLKFGFEARNLLGTEYQEYQERGRRIDINKYDLGRSVSVSLSTEF